MMFFHILLSGTHISYLSDPRKSAQNCVANCHRELAHISLLPEKCFSLKGFNISISFVTALFRKNAMITTFECGLLTALKIHPACPNITMLGKYINSEREGNFEEIMVRLHFCYLMGTYFLCPSIHLIS